MSKFKNIFNTIKVNKPKANTFDLTHDVKMSGQMGNLMPTLALECVPGDRINLGCDSMIRFAPLIAPIMHRVDVTMHYFFVPNRIVWPNWEKFIVNEPTGGLPFLEIDLGTTTTEQRKFLDYMGVCPPPAGANLERINAIPFAAYQCIYNEYYRDQNLISEVPYELTDGLNGNTTLLEMRKRAWEHDYFTAALPFAQKGNAVDIPLGEVTLKSGWDASSNPTFVNGIGGVNGGDIMQNIGGPIMVDPDPDPVAFDPDGSLEVGPTTINDLRRAFKLQEWLEKNARAGTRYIENILAHFGVRSSDKRLQRPEYITGTKAPVVISEVLNTTGVDGELPQGNMAGHGVSIGKGYVGNYFCEEHGYIIGIMSIMPKPAYMQGIPRNYLKRDPLEFYWPSFAHIGEQEVKNREIFAYGANGDDTFGYIPRYSEYKYMPSRVAGDFRTTLNFWHMGRIFANQPLLQQEFIECDHDEVNRVFAVNGPDDVIYMHILHKIKARRNMPVFGTPML